MRSSVLTCVAIKSIGFVYDLYKTEVPVRAHTRTFTTTMLFTLCLRLVSKNKNIKSKKLKTVMYVSLV